MPRLGVLIAFLGYSCLLSAQAGGSDPALLAKARSAYDAAFTRDLISFDCAVDFGWKEHFHGFLKNLPASANTTAERLQGIKHRVFVDRSGAVISAQPTEPDLSKYHPDDQLEMVYHTMVTQGLNAWVPFSMNEILPVVPVHYDFVPLANGYKLSLKGPQIQSELLLTKDLRITSGVSQLPQPLRFETEFVDGPHGYLLKSVRTGSSDGSTSGDATFAYTYQDVDGVELPSTATVSPATSEPWTYRLVDCKVVKGVRVNALPKLKPTT